MIVRILKVFEANRNDLIGLTRSSRVNFFPESIFFRLGICRGDHPQSRHFEYRQEQRQLALGTLGLCPFVPDGRSMPVGFYD